MKSGGKVKKQGYKDRKDESIAMRVKKKRTAKQLKDARDESYGKFGSAAKKSGKINRQFMNSRRMNRLEELGRVDAERARTRKGKRNLRDEKSRIVRELKADGGKVKPKRRKAGPKAGRPAAATPSQQRRMGTRSKPKVIRIIEVNKENVMADGGKVVGDYVEKKRSEFKSKRKDLKKVKPNQKGLKKLPTEVRNKMGYMKKGGRV